MPARSTLTDMAELHLHVGLYKTGTSTIQAALDTRVDALATAGVLYPGGGHRAHRLATYDLLGQRVRGEDVAVAGAFRRLTEEVATYGGPSVLISDEGLGLCRPRHVRRVVRGFGSRDVHVVIGARDMARTVVSAWQQDVMTGSTTEWRDFIAGVRHPEGGQVPDATAFWVRYDLLRVLDVWSSAVPLDRITVVTVPRAGASPQCLLDRFAAATGLPPDVWGVRAVAQQNVSLGAAEVEVVRRLNLAVGRTVNQAQLRFVVEQGLRPRLAVARPRRLRLPDEHRAWAREYAEDLVGELRRRGVAVVGELEDLVPDDRTDGRPPFDEVAPAELLEAAEAALAALAVGHGHLFRRYRRAFLEREGRPASASEVVGSSARAFAFGLRKQLLRRTADSPLLARAARVYVVRTAGRR